MHGQAWVIIYMKTASVMEAEIYINKFAVVHQFVHQLDNIVIFDFALQILINPHFSDYITLSDIG